MDDIDFTANGGQFLQVDDIAFIGPTVKDYSHLSIALLATEDNNPFSLSYVMGLARARDAEGQKSQWYMQGGPERKIASNIYSTA